jgi:hypothetical protein
MKVESSIMDAISNLFVKLDIISYLDLELGREGIVVVLNRDSAGDPLQN